MSKKKELPAIKPCPPSECGAAGPIINGTDDGRWEWVQCCECWAEGPRRRSVRGAINAWNKRAQ